jgi:membrane fusion protein, heavy metal efflux system
MKHPIIYAVFCGILITACGTNKTENKEEAPKVESKTEIDITLEQFKAVGIELGSVEQKNLKSVVKASGYLAVPPQNKASVSTYIGAVVKSISVLEGSHVKRGQVLAILEHPDFIKIQENYQTAVNEFNLSEKDFERQKELAEHNAGTGKVFQKAQADYSSAKTKVASLKSQLTLLGVNADNVSQGRITSSISVTAPIEGYIGHINAETGAYAEPNKTLFEIVDNTKIHCDLLVYEKDLFKVKVGQKVNFILANLPEHQEDHNNETIEGEIFGINKSFENDTKALTVHASIKNEKHELIPGMYVNALIDVGEQTTMAVPVDAVVKSEGKEYIFILAKTPANDVEKEKTTKEKSESVYSFKMIEVVTGVSDLGFVEIKPVDEIPQNAKVVIKNPFFILSKAKEGEGGEE